MEKTMFDPKSKVTSLRGKEYLEVKWRLVWFRDERKDGAILTEVVSTSPLLIKATIMDGNKILATGYGTAQVKANAVWNGREVEKAETAAIGRALAHAGYGTQFTDEDEGDHLADAPVEKQDASDGERKTKAFEMFSDLVVRAKAVNLTVPPMDAGWSIEKMRAHYKEQLHFVIQAEEQAKAGE
jgi:hypothetical protein